MLNKRQKQNNGRVLRFILVLSLSLVIIGNFSLFVYGAVGSIYQEGGSFRIIEHPMTEEWLSNGNFSEVPYPTWQNSTTGDESDIVLQYDSDSANAVILGEQINYPITADPPDNTWFQAENPDFPTPPDNADITPFGCYADHYWDESADQSPSVHWNKKFAMPVNTSDYEITSVQLEAEINATVSAEGDNPGLGEYGLEVPGDSTEGGDQSATYDYARFYVLFSDPTGGTKYEVAYYQTVDLGADSEGEFDYLYDTNMLVVPEDSLRIFLESVLDYDHTHFNVTLGIRLWCEDNWNSDDDQFDELYIKNFKLNVTLRKKIDQFTILNFEHTGRKLTSDNLNVDDIRIDLAHLNFQYKVNQSWPSSDSPNSEIRCLINGKTLNETVTLSNAKTTYQGAKSGAGFDVTSLISKTENITAQIQVNLADDFNLNESIMISFDNASLLVQYTELERVYVPLSDQAIFLIFILLGVTALLGYIIINEKVIKPKNERIRETLRLKTQVIEDARNIQGIFIIKKSSSKIVYSLASSNVKNASAVLPSYSANVIKFSNKMGESGDNGLESKTFHSAFEDFSVLVCEGKEFRSSIVLKEPPSENLKHTAIIMTEHVDRSHPKMPKDKKSRKHEYAEIISDLFRFDLMDIFTYAPEVNVRIMKKEFDEPGRKIIDKCTRTYYRQKYFDLIDIYEDVPPEHQLTAKSILLDMVDAGLLIPYDTVTKKLKKERVKLDKSDPRLSADQTIEESEAWMEVMRKTAERETDDIKRNELTEQLKRELKA